LVRVTEELEPGDVPLWRHPGWNSRFPWLVQGTTGRGDRAEPFDLGLFGASPVGDVLDRWKKLRSQTGIGSTLHARQVHGSRAGSWDDPLPAGLCVVEGLDAHVTGRPGLLLAVSVADCVPIFLVSEDPRVVAVIHAGWRGVAGGALESTMALLARRGVSAEDVWLHTGPSICGRCYEVGPEVHAAVHPDRQPPTAPAPIDLREAIAGRAGDLGIPAQRVSQSLHCTLCGPPDFFSHRGGDPGRQMAVIGMLE
jgi:YfiH family protein